MFLGQTSFGWHPNSRGRILIAPVMSDICVVPRSEYSHMHLSDERDYDFKQLLFFSSLLWNLDTAALRPILSLSIVRVTTSILFHALSKYCIGISHCHHRNVSWCACLPVSTFHAQFCNSGQCWCGRFHSDLRDELLVVLEQRIFGHLPLHCHRHLWAFTHACFIYT
jgi:hypothetical protein